MATTLYDGPALRARNERVVFVCRCGERVAAELVRVHDLGETAPAAGLAEGRPHRVGCPHCQTETELALSVVLHDRVLPRVIIWLPDGLRHQEIDARVRLLEAIQADGVATPEYVFEPVVLFGAEALAMAVRPATGAAPKREAAPGAARALAVAAKAAAPREEDSTNPVVQLPESAPARPAPAARAPDLRATIVDRWITGREGPAAVLLGDRVVVLASATPSLLEAIIGSRIELRVQLHRLPSYPVITLTLVGSAEDADGESRPDEQRAIFVTLDVTRAAHRLVLDTLAQRTSVVLELYDMQYLQVSVEEVAAPLEENVRRIITDAQDALERLAPSARNWERARSALFHPSYDRLGRTVVSLPGPSDEAADKPSAALAALGQVTRWSEPSAEAYLVEIRSYPIVQFRKTRARIVERALDWGLAVSRALVERCEREFQKPQPAWPELVRQLARRFADVSARKRPNDLSVTEEAENWERLLYEATQANVMLDENTRQLANQAARRMRAGSGGGVDLRGMSTTELLALLDKKEMRREAALLICERGESQALGQLFSAVRRMPRAEANVILPSTTAFGTSAEKWLIEGLQSKKSYIRQGCALSLGVLGTATAVEALVNLLVEEPTEIWSEVARALGDVGAQVVQPLAGRVREVDGERRERLVHALAHVAARDAAGGPKAVQKLATARDPVVAGVAERALALRGEIGALDRALRPGGGGEAPEAKGDLPAEHTVVRSFSRRFYEALRSGAGAIELDSDDLQELELEPDDEDDDAPPAKSADRHSSAAGEIPASRGGQARGAAKPARGGGKVGHGVHEETTSPHPRSNLPGDGR